MGARSAVWRGEGGSSASAAAWADAGRASSAAVAPMARRRAPVMDGAVKDRTSQSAAGRGRSGWSESSGGNGGKAAGAGNTLAIPGMSDLETERLQIVQWAPRHSVLLARLAAQPEVMRHVGT